jgi:hypothetical protein
MRKLIVAVAAAAVLVVPGGALGEEEPFGHHVSQCARSALPPADPPVIVCEHDGEVHTFATFGEMVLFHLLVHHG